MTQLSVWELVKTKKFEEACELADFEFNQSRSLLPLRNKVLALLHLENYTEVIKLSKELIELENGASERDFVYLGLSYWFLKDRQAAVETWQSSEKCKYSDASGGVKVQVLLFYASLVLSDEKLKAGSIKNIKKLLKSKQSKNWPGPVGNFILDEIDYITLLNYVSQTPILRERELSQAFFAKAIKEYEKGSLEAYSKLLEDIKELDAAAFLEAEYYMAKGELKTKS